MAILSGIDGDHGPTMAVFVHFDLATRKVVGPVKPSPHECMALVDTGARQSRIDTSIVAALGLQQVGQVIVHSTTTGASPQPLSLYSVSLA